MTLTMLNQWWGIVFYSISPAAALTIKSTAGCHFLDRGGAAGAVQPPGRPRGPREVLHRQGAAAGSKPRRGGQRSGGQLAGSHDPALQQRSLAGRWILPPGQRER